MIDLLVCAQQARSWRLEGIIFDGEEEGPLRSCFGRDGGAQTISIYLVANLAREAQDRKWLVEACEFFEALKFLIGLVVIS